MGRSPTAVPRIAGFDPAGVDGLTNAAEPDALPCPADGHPLEIAIDRLIEDPRNARRRFPQGSLDELTAAVLANGVIEPLLVVAIDAGRFEVRSGARRLRAARAAGLTQVPVILREALDDVAGILVNVMREELDPFDLADALATTIAGTRTRASDIAKKLGKSEAWLSNCLAIGQIPDDIREHLRSIDATDLRALGDLARLYRRFPVPVKRAVLETPILSRRWVSQFTARLDVLQMVGRRRGPRRPPAGPLSEAVQSEPAPSGAGLVVSHDTRRWVLRPDLTAAGSGSIVAVTIDGEALRCDLMLPLTVEALI